MKVICWDCTLVYFNYQSGLSVIYRQGNAVMDESASKVTLASGKRESTFGRERVWKEEATTIQETLPKLSSQAPKPTWIQSKVHLRPRSWRTSRFCEGSPRLGLWPEQKAKSRRCSTWPPWSWAAWEGGGWTSPPWSTPPCWTARSPAPSPLPLSPRLLDPHLLRLLEPCFLPRDLCFGIVEQDANVA